MGARAAQCQEHVNGLVWIGGLALYLAVLGGLHTVLGRSRLDLSAALISAPLSAVFLAWTGRVLSARRLERREIVPFAAVGSVLLAVYAVGATVYLPHLFNTLSTRYGVIGAVFAMISGLFCGMCVVVVSAAACREVRDELDRIRRGAVPAEDEVQRQWQAVTAQAWSRWETLRAALRDRRRRP